MIRGRSSPSGYFGMWQSHATATPTTPRLPQSAQTLVDAGSRVQRAAAEARTLTVMAGADAVTG